MAEGQNIRGRIKVVVVGLGFIARDAHLPALSQCAEVEVVGIQDENEAALERYPYYRGFTDLSELLETTRPDAAYVLTPQSTHEAIVRQLVDAKVHIFCEKPLAADTPSARRIVALADDSEKVVMVGFNRRHAPATLIAKEHFGTQRPSVGVFQKSRPGRDYRASLENLIHMVDLARFFLGECIAVEAMTQYEDPWYEDAVAALLRFDTGSIGFVLGTFGVCGQWTERADLYGGGASVLIDAPNTVSIVDNFVTHTTNQSPLHFGLDHPIDKFGFRAETLHFLDCVRTGAQPHPSVHDALRTQELMEEIFRVGGLPVEER
jgi:virulence factor